MHGCMSQEYIINLSENVVMRNDFAFCNICIIILIRPNIMCLDFKFLQSFPKTWKTYPALSFGIYRGNELNCKIEYHMYMCEYNEDIIISISVINVEFGFFHRKCCFCYTLFLFTFAKIPWISIICFLCMLKTCVYADMDMGRPVRLLRFAFSLFLCIKSLLFLLQLDSTWYENVVVKENGKGKSNLFLGCSPYRMTLKRWTRVE